MLPTLSFCTWFRIPHDYIVQLADQGDLYTAAWSRCNSMLVSLVYWTRTTPYTPNRPGQRLCTPLCLRYSAAVLAAGILESIAVTDAESQLRFADQWEPWLREEAAESGIDLNGTAAATHDAAIRQCVRDILLAREALESLSSEQEGIATRG